MGHPSPRSFRASSPSEAGSPPVSCHRPAILPPPAPSSEETEPIAPTATETIPAPPPSSEEHAVLLTLPSPPPPDMLFLERAEAPTIAPPAESSIRGLVADEPPATDREPAAR